MCSQSLVLVVHSLRLKGNHYQFSYISAILVTGGDDTLKSAEMLLSDGTPWCSVPNLPYETYAHSQSGLVACGGVYSKTSCFTLSEGQWTTSHSLLNIRYHHSSWSSPNGTILLGGEATDSRNSTEMLADSGGSQQSFTLQYETQ